MAVEFLFMSKFSQKNVLDKGFHLCVIVIQSDLSTVPGSTAWKLMDNMANWN